MLENICIDQRFTLYRQQASKSILGWGDGYCQLQNQLLIKHTADKTIIIPEEAWIEVRQNFEHIQIFDCRVSIYILSEKRSKSDVYRIWNGIFIGYIDTTKHFKIWAPKTHQVLIANKPVVNESKQGVELLVDNPIPLPKLLWQPARKPQPRGRPRKRPRLEDTIIEKIAKKENASRDELAQAIIHTKRMRIYPLYNPKLSTDLEGTSSKNLTDRLIKLMQKLVKLVTKTSSKV